jgi:zinc D-Ala-D-Ala carboxypeptidase|tara:strand:+ start:832 stop:1197 length:366 start_codon:yes stop_codon:yes gene_type:complete
MNYFTPKELQCQHSGEDGIEASFLEKLNAIRQECDFPFTVTSGYRSPEHPIEAKKEKPGAHSSGRAVDIGVRGLQALRLVEVAIKHGMTGIGVQQKGGGRFIHLDDIEADDRFSRPTIWSY